MITSYKLNFCCKSYLTEFPLVNSSHFLNIFSPMRLPNKLFILQFQQGCIVSRSDTTTLVPTSCSHLFMYMGSLATRCLVLNKPSTMLTSGCWQSILGQLMRGQERKIFSSHVTTRGSLIIVIITRWCFLQLAITDQSSR